MGPVPVIPSCFRLDLEVVELCPRVPVLVFESWSISAALFLDLAETRNRNCLAMV